MPLNLPNLDDRTYADLVAEARALIPTLAPEWTNHNPSDPGITLVELFAYLTEMLIYRVNRVTDDNTLAFLKLLNGPDWTPAPTETLAVQIRAAVLALREPNRAVTNEDFERLARAADSGVARARSLSRRNLEAEHAGAPIADQPGHISVMIVPKPGASSSLIQNVKDYFDPPAGALDPHQRHLLTTQVHVVSPKYFAFGIRLTLWLKPDAVEDEFLSEIDLNLQTDLDTPTLSNALRAALASKGISLSQNATLAIQTKGSEWSIVDQAAGLTYTIRKEPDQVTSAEHLNVYRDLIRFQTVGALRQYFDPLTGGADGEGWPFGRNAFVSEVYQLLDRQPGIDYVTKTSDPGDPQKTLDEFTVADASRLLRNAQGDLVAVKIQPDEVIDVQTMTFDLTIGSAK